MSQVKTILKALVALGTSTYDDLEQKTEIPRNKLRWTCNSMKQAGQIKQTEEPLTKEVAWQITPVGRIHFVKLAGEDIKAAPALKKDEPAQDKTPGKFEKGMTEAMAKTKAKAEKKSNVKQTLAGGGADNTGSRASDSHVVAASTSHEGAAVDEQPKPEAPPSPVSACSDVTQKWEGEDPFPGPFAAGPMINIAPEIVIKAEKMPDPSLFAMVSIDGSLHIEFAGKEVNLPAFAVRKLNDFLEDTHPAWN